MWKWLKAWLDSSAERQELVGLERDGDVDLHVLEAAGDGDCLSAEAILTCVQCWRPEYSEWEVEASILHLVGEGKLVGDDFGHYVDPIARPNAAKQMRETGRCFQCKWRS